MKIIVTQGQSIYDISVQYTGTNEHAVAILTANNRNSLVISAGDLLIVPDTLIVRKTATFFSSNAIQVACEGRKETDSPMITTQNEEYLLDSNSNNILYQ